MIERNTNKEDIAKVINHPKVWDMVSDDLSRKPYVPSDDNVYLMDDKKLGVVEIEALNGVTCIIHIAATPKLWGKVEEFIDEVLSLIFTKTRFMKIIAFIPAYNKPTIGLAEKSGMEKEGCISRSFLKGWELHDQLIYGLTKEKFREGILCHQQQQQQ